MIRDVHHVGIAVLSLERAYALYRDALGLPQVKESHVPSRGVRAAVLSVGASYLELIEPVSDTSPFARHISEHGEGLHHLALWSDCIEADLAALREKDVPLADKEPREGFTGRLSYLKPEAFDGALLEVVEPQAELTGHRPSSTRVKRIDHVVVRVPAVQEASQRMLAYFGVQTKRTFERGTQSFAFMRPGDIVIEVIGPRDGGAEGSAKIAGLALEVEGIDDLTESLKGLDYPVGDPHPALQGGRIVSVHASGACGVPLAFIDFTGSPAPRRRESS